MSLKQEKISIIDIKNTKKKLFFINKLIQSKTNNKLSVHFDFYKNYYLPLPLFFNEYKYLSKNNILILALKLNDEFVSTITCDVFITHITISSKTSNMYLNCKYNLILRSIIILLCNSIKVSNKYIYTIRSYIINTISEKSMIKHFNAKYSETDKDILEIICNENTINNSFEKLNYLLDNLL